jgi:hypothetical protein
VEYRSELMMGQSPRAIADSAVTAEPPAKGTLSGIVVGPDGRPVANARVWAEQFDGKTASRLTLVEARTNAQGRFRLGPAEPVYRLRFGLSVDADGTPRPDAEVTATVYRRELGHTVVDIGPRGILTPDADGRFRTPPLPVGELACLRTSQPS